MKFFVEHWKELLVLGGAISFPAIGFLSSSQDWSNPSGYYTKATLTIENNFDVAIAKTSYEEREERILRDYQFIQVGKLVDQPSAKSSDLVAEFPLKNLDKSNWWRYCLPKSSKLTTSGPKISSSSQSATEQDCSLSWWKKTNDSNSKNVSYLLDLMIKFLKLKHQMNLITLFRSSTNSQVTSSSDNLLRNIKNTCKISDSSFPNSFLSYMFTSPTPISKNCLITPIKMNMNLKINGVVSQSDGAASTNNSYSLDQLKRGIISGNIEYSITDYYGKLHSFSSSSRELSNISLTLEPRNKKYELYLDHSSIDAGNNKLDFWKLYEKYQHRELKLEDFNRQENK